MMPQPRNGVGTLGKVTEWKKRQWSIREGRRAKGSPICLSKATSVGTDEGPDEKIKYMFCCILWTPQVFVNP